MSVDIFPVGVSGLGTVRVQAVASLANKAAPKLTELNAASSVDASPYFPAGAYAPTHSQETVDDTRLSDRTARVDFGRSSFDLTLSYVYDPQGTGTEPGNKMYGFCVPFTQKQIVQRNGPFSDLPFVVGQFVDVFDIKFGDRFAPTPGNDTGSKHMITQVVSFTRVQEHVAVVA